MAEFVSEPITPVGQPDTSAMSRGEPGLPTAFTWRRETFTITRCLQSWKQSAPEGGKPTGERYLRRHCYLLEMSDRTLWQIYFTRQTPKSGRPTQRWFLYSIEKPTTTPQDPCRRDARSGTDCRR